MASILTVAAVTLSQPALAAGLRCAVTDPEGDAFLELTSTIPAQPYRDIVQIEVTKVGRSVFTFAMDMVGEVPAAPAFLLPSESQMIWSWQIDTDTATAPAGFPVAPGHTEPFEFVVRVIWDGGTFHGEFIDRRPLLTGGSALVLPASFKISKSTISASVDAEAMGDPTGFRWAGFAGGWEANQEGNSGLLPLDVVPSTDCPAM